MDGFAVFIGVILVLMLVGSMILVGTTNWGYGYQQCLEEKRAGITEQQMQIAHPTIFIIKTGRYVND